jgi:6-phosphofructokinase 2
MIPSQIPILSVTVNPALDMATTTPEVAPGPKLRCAAPVEDPGGGGLNVARAIRLLGGAVRTLAALGGATGDRIAVLLREEGIEVEVIPAPGPTRISLSVIEGATGRQFRFVMPGPDWSGAEAALVARIGAAAPVGGITVVSGSLPPGIAPDFLRRVAAALGGGTRLVFDTSGAPLADLAARAVPGLALLRMDEAEAAALAGGALDTRAGTLAFARDLVARGVARQVVVARGAEGSVLATGACDWACVPPRVAVVSTVGAGDSYLGAHVLAMARGAAPEEALRAGVAAAAAAVMTGATDLCRRADAERLVADCVLERL